jgi:hypothetical protein
MEAAREEKVPGNPFAAEPAERQARQAIADTGNPKTLWNGFLGDLGGEWGYSVLLNSGTAIEKVTMAKTDK